ncbi:MAG TPA: small ribosomal subunit Rsm22 family protein [Chlamydiales bacterium]|jgi:ribosomal protein RSM22 (predicted rRNA methylase)|nr:small ribosomal subunit Rsm22 family protein [Chlamydiales bacterium]
MQLPIELQEAIQALTQTRSTKNLREAREKLSADYRKGASSANAFQDSSQLVSYLATRMPATYAANVRVFQAIRERLPQFQCRSLFDLGAGPGTASWAALEIFAELSELHLVERESSAIQIGQQLSAHQPILREAKWQCSPLQGNWRCEAADLAVLSYVFAEMNRAESLSLLRRLFEEKISLVAIVEPGTPQGFERIRLFRELALQQGAQIIAPCPHPFACPMQGNDWCHFSARAERTRLHRQLKQGSLGYEDEKYSYVVYAKPNFTLPPMEGRVIRSPQKGSGFVRLSLCSNEGTLQEITVTRSDRENYRSARDSEWGSIWK